MWVGVYERGKPHPTITQVLLDTKQKLTVQLAKQKLFIYIIMIEKSIYKSHKQVRWSEN